MIHVLKRNGQLEPIDISKISRVIDWASEGLDVSVSQVELNAKIQFFEGVKTSDVHAMLVKSAADLTSVSEPDYQYLAARLAIFAIRKTAYGQFEPPALGDHLTQMIETGKYDKHLLEDYSTEEIAEIDTWLDHERDMNFAYAGVVQLEGKYLVQDRTTGQVFESPQMMYIAIAMALFSAYPKNTRLKYVRKLYDALSTFKISFPTPIMGGVRTPSRQFSSCVLIEVGDSLESISEASRAVVQYVSQRAGIGLNIGAIRGIGSPIRGGEAEHTGVIPFLKLFQASVKSCSQGGIRGGAATVFYPMWHIEYESLIVLKNNRGVEENRVRQMDYGVQLNKLMYERLIKGGDISFFSPSDVPGLLDAFYADQAKFEELYLKYEADDSIRKTTLPATQAFSMLMQERAGTGRIYIHNVDHSNTHSPFDPQVAPVKQSNLCLEVLLPTEPVYINGQGEIALCTLSAFNLGLLKLSEIEELADLQVRALDALLDYQDYMMPQAYNHSMAYRPLGIGVISYAEFLAKRGLKYSDGSANNITHELFEAIQFYLLKASNKLAREKHPCLKFSNTMYSKGVLPIDTYKRDIDAVHTAELKLDWEGLRKDIKEYGLRNATLTALMPSETSSQISGSTSGIEPVRSLVTTKGSKDGVYKQVAPRIGEVVYEQYWDMVRSGGNKGYLELMGIMQKFVDQSISANTAYDPTQYPNNLVPMNLLLRDLMVAYKLGVKTLYYQNSFDDADLDEDDGCAGGACKI